MTSRFASTASAFQATAKRKWFILAAFRIGALALAATEAGFAPGEFRAGIPLWAPLLAASVYTLFKVAHPLRWYQTTRSEIALTTLDLAVCLGLILISGQIHMAFAKYTLAPVLTSALLRPPRTTLVVALATASYYTAIFFEFPLPVAIGNLNSILAMYFTALGLTALLPYTINSLSGKDLQSKTMLDERLQVGREIHDGLCQMIYGLRWQVQKLLRDADCTARLALHLKQLAGLLDDAEKEARGYIGLLRTIRDTRPFLSQLSEFLEHLKSDTGMGYRLEAEDGEPDLDGLVHMEALHICEEALRNAAKHSRANLVTVVVRSPNGLLHVDISDEGCGFSRTDPRESYGLAVMKERAEAIGGRLTVLSAPGMGTKIHMEVPRRWSLELTQ